MTPGNHIFGRTTGLAVAFAALLTVFVLTGQPDLRSANGHFSVAKSRECRNVPHVPFSDILSTSIRVRRMSCGRVRYWIKRGEGSWEGIPDRFRCRYRTRRHGDRHDKMPHMDFKCVLPGRNKKFAWSATWRISPWR